MLEGVNGGVGKNAIFMFNNFKLIYCRIDNCVVPYYNARFSCPKVTS